MTEIKSIHTKTSTPRYKKLGDKSYLLCVYPRVHMFSIDLSLKSGILKHGSFGFSIKDLPIKITVTKNNHKKDIINSRLNIDKLDHNVNFKKLRSYIRCQDHWNVNVELSQELREHIGLGLSTQITGGILLCCAKASGLSLTIDDLFKLGVGHNSTLGLNLLLNPGFVIELGCEIANKDSGLIVNPNMYTHYEKPVNYLLNITDFPYYIIVAIPNTKNSLSLDTEDDFWNKILPDTEDNTKEVVYEVFEKLLPSLVTDNYEEFIYTMAHIIATGTKVAEENIQSPATKAILHTLREKFEFAGVSSMGPAVYSFSQNDPSNALDELSDLYDYQFIIMKRGTK